MFNRVAAPQSRAPLAADSRCLFHFDCADYELDAETGDLIAITEHRGNFARGSNTMAATDANGTAYTAEYPQPAWSSRDWPDRGDLDPAPAFGLELGPYDRVAFPYAIPWQAHKGLYAMIETGGRLTDDATVFGVANNAVTGPAMWIRANTGNSYEMQITDGTLTATATIPSGLPVSGDRVVFDWRLDDAGYLTFGQSINYGERTSARSSGAINIPATTASDLFLWINSRGAGINPSQGWFRRAKMVAGNPPYSVLLGLR